MPHDANIWPSDPFLSPHDPVSNLTDILSRTSLWESLKLIRLKTWPVECSQTILTIKGTQLCHRWSDVIHFQTHPRLYAYHYHLQVSWKSNQKNEEATLFHKVNNGHFDSQRDVTLLLLALSDPFSNSSESLSLSLISARFMKIQLEMKKLRCSQGQ